MRHWGFVFGLGIALGLFGCREPTQITVELTTDVPCSQLQGAFVRVGTLGVQLETAPHAADVAGDRCTLTGRIGSLVVVPSGDRSAEVAIQVVAGVHSSAAACEKAPYAGCIVARRALHFVEHSPLDLPISIDAECEDRVCKPGETCVRKYGCVPATIPDPASCHGDACDESVLVPAGTPLADGGADADTNGEAGTDADADTGVPDADGGTPTSLPIAQVVAGNGFACARYVDGTVRCWGSAENGRLGNGAALDAHLPVTVSGLTDAQQISAGLQGACAVHKDKTVSCWGGDTGKLFPDGAHSTPVPVSGLTNVAEVSIGKHGCARTTDGHVWCWGSNDVGQLGNGTIAPSDAYVAPAVISTLTGVTALWANSCAILGDTTVRCWGEGQATPTEILGVTNVAGVSMANDGALAVWTDSGQVYRVAHRASGGWDAAVPYPLVGAVKSVSITEYSLTALLTDGTVVTTGDFGVAPKPVSGFADVVELDGNWIYPLYVDAYYACARTKTGAVLCFGDDFYGVLGRGKVDIFRTPVQPAVSGVVHLRHQDFDFDQGGGVIALGPTTPALWGHNYPLASFGATPTTSALLGTDVLDVSSGNQNRLLVRRAAGVDAFFDGALVAPPDGLAASSFSDFTRIVARFEWELGLRPTGDLVWAAVSDTNTAGIVGDGTTSPVTKGTIRTLALPGGAKAAGFTASGRNFQIFDTQRICAWTAAGALYCWGDDTFGECGDGTTTRPLSTPTLVAFTDPKPKVVAASTGDHHTCAVTDAADGGSVYCWGRSNRGQLGLGTPLVDAMLPKKVPGLANVVGVDSFFDSTCAWLADGTAYCWGENDLGEVGDGTVVDRSSPVKLPLSNVKELEHSCAVLGDGTVRCWGESWRGGVGTGVMSPFGTAAPVLGLSP